MSASASLNTTSPSYDVVIVGSGHNGLIAANYLARAGLSVAVIESKSELGGATQSQRVFPDYDAWLSRYSYLISLLPKRILQDLGLQLRLLPRRIGSFTAYEQDAAQRGFLVDNASPEVTRDFIVGLGGAAEWQGYQEFAALTHEIAKIFWETLLQPLKSRSTFVSSLSTDLQRRAWDCFVRRPLGETIESCVQHDALRGLLMTDGKIGVHTHPHDESLLQNRCFLYHVVGGGNGQWMVPQGGMRALVSQLEQQGLSRGVVFHRAWKAVQVETGPTQHRVYCETELGERELLAAHVLVNAAPSQLATILGQAHAPSIANEGSVVKVNMLLRKLPRLCASGIDASDAFTGSFHVDEGYTAMLESYRQADTGQLPLRPPFEMYCHSLTDPSILGTDLVDRGFHTLTLFGLDVPYRLFAQDNGAQRNAVLQRYFAAMDRVCDGSFVDCLAIDASGEPCVEIKSALDLEQELGLDQGNIFHNAPSWFFTDSESAEGTWGVETGVERVYVAGSSAHRGGAVSGIPGFSAAMQVLQDRNML